MSDTMNFDELEFELRKLPGVRAAGFTEADDMIVVQVQVAGESPGSALSQQAARIAYRHADRPVALEIVRWRTPSVAPAPQPAVAAPPVTEALPAPAPGAPSRPPRVRLLAVLTFPDADELEVHLTFEGRRVIGRADASSAVTGAVEATIEALGEFAPELDTAVTWVKQLKTRDGEETPIVACDLRVDDHSVMGIATGGSPIEAAARATLHGLNRSLEVRLHPIA
jgi:hypothetical protein